LTSKDERDKLAALDRRMGWETIMSTPSARRVIWEQFEVFGIYQVAANVDKHGALAFNEGRRSLALQIMNELMAECPELYDRMTIENRARLRLERTEAEKERDQ
jgi:hypothetical protein